MNGTVQCASSIVPETGSICDGFAWNPLHPVSALPMTIESSAGTSPSQAEGIPSALRRASARQPVFPRVSRRSKQRMVSPERPYLLTVSRSAEYIPIAPSTYFLTAAGASFRRPSAIAEAGSGRGVPQVFLDSSMRSLMSMSRSSIPSFSATAVLSGWLAIRQSDGLPMMPSFCPSRLLFALVTFARVSSSRRYTARCRAGPRPCVRSD